MVKISVHYDGWVAVPTKLRRLLGLKAGDKLEVEVEDGELILRPVGEASTAEEAPAAPESVPPPTPTKDKPITKRGRPRKIAVPAQSVKAAGRRKTTR